MGRSLHLQILAWILAPLFFLVLFNAWQSYSNAELVAGIVTDRTLVGSAYTIAEQIRMANGEAEVVVPPSALRMFVSGHQDRVVYRIADWDGRLLAGYLDVPGPLKADEPIDPLYFDAQFRGQTIRAVAMTQQLIGGDQPRFALVIVGETLRARKDMVAHLWIDETGRQVLLVVIAAALAWFGLNRGLAPLARISREIAQRPPDTLDLIATEKVQKELRPLVTALNESLDRVRNQIAIQRHFIADAAHQLRTPLSVLKAQISFGLGAGNSADKDRALSAVNDSVTQMTHLTNQLLTLAKIEPGAGSVIAERIDLVGVTRTVLEENADRALTKRINLSFDVDETEIAVFGSRALLHEMVLNIVDNAIQYVPPGGAIGVEISAQNGASILRVQDNGPGIPTAERERVFDRFYRILGTDAEGSGLGLAIVRQIAGRYGGTVRLDDPSSGTGLIVEVTLPLATATG